MFERTESDGDVFISSVAVKPSGLKLARLLVQMNQDISNAYLTQLVIAMYV